MRSSATPTNSGQAATPAEVSVTVCPVCVCVCVSVCLSVGLTVVCVLSVPQYERLRVKVIQAVYSAPGTQPPQKEISDADIYLTMQVHSHSPHHAGTAIHLTMQVRSITNMFISPVHSCR